MLKKVLLAFALALIVLGIVIQVQPNQYSVTRSTDIAATPDRIFPLLNDFHQWGQWSPWEKLDPAMKRTYEGAPSGTGAVYKWSGNSQAGEGNMTITESKPNERLAVRLEFVKPFAGLSTTTFTLTPQGGSTHVNWGMVGESSFMSKAINLFAGLDKMVGPDFERGLSQLKTRVESSK